MKCNKCFQEVEAYANKKWCKECYNSYMREYMLQRYYRRRDRFIYSRGGACEQCGSTKSLEIDHVSPETKNFDVSKALSGWSESRLNKELDKCQVLCKDCHLIKTRKDLAERFGQREYWEHGTSAGYRNCRCDKCTEFHVKYMKEYWERVKTEPITEHGKLRAYGQGCRCAECKEAKRKSRAK